MPLGEIKLTSLQWLLPNFLISLLILATWHFESGIHYIGVLVLLGLTSALSLFLKNYLTASSNSSSDNSEGTLAQPRTGSIQYAFLGTLLVNLLLLNTSVLNGMPLVRIALLLLMGSLAGSLLLHRPFGTGIEASPSNSTWAFLDHPAVQYGFLLLMLVAGFSLRIYNVKVGGVAVDEDAHVYAGFRLYNEGEMGHKRCPELTYVIGWFYKFLNPETYADYVGDARIAASFLGTLGTIAIFYISRLIQPRLIYVTTLLFAISPFAIGMARYAREYTYYGTLLLFLILALMTLAPLLKGVLPKRKWTIGLAALYLVYILFYLVTGHWNSTLLFAFPLILIFVFSYILFHLSEIYHFWLGKLGKAKLMGGLALLLVLGVVAGFLIINRFPERNVFKLLLSSAKFQANYAWSNVYFLPSAKMPWHWWQGVMADNFGIYTLFALCFMYIFGHRKKQLGAIVLTSIIIMVLYVYVMPKGFVVRRVYYNFLLYLFGIGGGLYFLLSLWPRLQINSLLKWSGLALCSLLMLYQFNLGTTLSSIQDPQFREFRNVNNGEFVLDKLYLEEYFSNLSPEEVKDDLFISKQFSVFFNMIFGDVKSVSYIPKRMPKWLRQSPTGWLVLHTRHGRPADFPKGSQFVYEKRQFKLISTANHINIYRWEPAEIEGE